LWLAEILHTFQQLFRCAPLGGGLLITVQDYDQEEREGTQFKPYGVRQENGKRYFIFQVWGFEREKYEVSMYVVEDNREGECITHIMRTKYYAMQEAGFDEVQRLNDYFFQPVIVGKKKQE
jgi:hypothetical protein